jgi:hypothetical protein
MAIVASIRSVSNQPNAPPVRVVNRLIAEGENSWVSAAGDFVDGALQNEASWSRAVEEQSRFSGELRFYGASVGAVRGTVRDCLRRYPGLDHDEITALGSELWAEPVFERRLAAIVLLQTRVGLLLVSDLTRLEGFVRTATTTALVDPLVTDVIAPLIRSLDAAPLRRAQGVIERWASDPDPWLRHAARGMTDAPVE